MSPDRDRIKALYDAAPYPEVLQGRMRQPMPLLDHWINAASTRRPLGPGARILVAGCGSGAEALLLKDLFPEASVVGLDFSPPSIARAESHAASRGLEVRFEVADLMDPTWVGEHELFDFILCRGVADYVTDPELLLVHLGRSLRRGGVVYVMANSPHHPAGRIRQAFARLGLEPGAFDDSPEQRRLLGTIEQIMGDSARLQGVAKAPKAYLDVDIFAPIAHHDPLQTWIDRAGAAELDFAGSTDAPTGVASLTDDQLGPLLGLDRAALSLWFAELAPRPGLNMLFVRDGAEAPNFRSLRALSDWRPVLDPCVGQLPALAGDPAAPRHLTLRFEGLADLVIYSSALDLEVLRRCDGRASLGRVLAELPPPPDPASLMSSIFRAYHYGILADAPT
ncbi:MAG: class I SAM-dependent methyltransferase [Deltaproteobacteria bacterium]|nr:MAG: class I SAM-dependent methyltransferase [Deltaproteobacteria bacterium]